MIKITKTVKYVTIFLFYCILEIQKIINVFNLDTCYRYTSALRKSIINYQ